VHGKKETSSSAKGDGWYHYKNAWATGQDETQWKHHFSDDQQSYGHIFCRQETVGAIVTPSSTITNETGSSSKFLGEFQQGTTDASLVADHHWTTKHSQTTTFKPPYVY
jgi:hypothetical protein